MNNKIHNKLWLQWEKLDKKICEMSWMYRPLDVFHAALVHEKIVKAFPQDDETKDIHELYVAAYMTAAWRRKYRELYNEARRKGILK